MKQLQFLDYDAKWINLKLEELFRIIKGLYPKYFFRMQESGLGYPEIVLEKGKVKLNIFIDRDAELGIWKNNVLVHFGVNTNKEGCGNAVNNFEEFYSDLPKYIDKFEEYCEELIC